ncbi:MAG: FtsK/SpoIIIE domain-containing protein, partial [Phycisphaerales bacterium]
MAEQQPSHPETGIAADQTITRIEKHALEQLTELVAYRDEAETSIDRTHKSRRASTDRQLEESLSELQARYERDRKVALSEYDATREDTTKHYDKEEKKAAREYEGQSFRVGEQADHDEAATKKLWKDARWTAETVYEAKEKQPSARCKKTTKALHGRLTGLQGMHSRAGELLRMYRQGGVAKRILAQHADGPATAALPEGSPAAVLEGISNDASSVLRTIQKAWFARWWIGIRPLGIILFIAAVAAALNGWMTEWKFDRLFMEFGIGAGVVSLLVLIGVYMLGRKQVTPHFEKLTLLTAKGSRAHDAAVEEAQALCEREEAALKKQRDDEILEAKLTFEPRLRKIAQVRKELLAELETKYTQLQKSLIERRAAASQEIEDRHAARMSGLESNFEREQAQLRASHTSTRSSLDETYAQEWNELESRWTSGMASLHNTVKSVRDDVATVSRPWTDSWWTSFKPPREFARAIRYGEFTVNLQALPGGIPRDPRLLNAGPFEITMPAVLDFPTRTSLLLETGDDAREEAADALRNVMMRLLTTLPAGQVRFTIIDPVGLGQNFAGFMHLADYEEAFVADRIWTETRHIEQRLTDLTEHMEDVIQKYLRNDFETITQYNLHAGEIAEPFRFLVIANFPVNFSDTAARRLVSIVDSGPRCGVYTLMTMDTRQAMPQGFQPQDLRKGGVVLVRDKGRWVNTDEVLKQWPLALDPAPAADFITETLKVVGEAAKDSTRVEVPFEHVTPPPDEYWTSDSSREIVVPLGRAGATKLQHLELGRGITQHALIAGRTGSGKSTLLHVLVTNLALRYHPDQLEFYLVDFKKGVEFKTYATHSLP